MSCCLSFVLGVGLQPCHWPCIMDRPWPCVVSCLQNPLDICCTQPCLWPCLLDRLWPHAVALPSAWSLALSAFAPGWIPWKDPGPAPSLACLCLLMDPIINTWLYPLRPVHVGLGPVVEDTAPQVEPPLVPGLSTLEEQLCSCCFLMHTFEVASS